MQTSTSAEETVQTQEEQEEETLVDETETETYQLLQEINIHAQNIEVCSITLIIVLSLVYGAKLCRIFLDKIWR